MNVSRIAHTFVFVLVFALIATGVWAAGEEEEEPAAAVEKEMVLDPSTGEMVEAPRYGGTFTHAERTGADTPDTWFTGGQAATFFISTVLEKLSVGNWAIAREEHGWNTTSVPLSTLKGALAESWSQPDPLTYVFNIRRGVHWHNKAPMNGRELTADDIVFNFHRYLGLGSGFTVPSPRLGQLAAIPFESIAATDQWTVVMKLKEPKLFALEIIVDQYSNWMYPPEVIEEHGDARDWRNLVGTGPYELTDYVEGVSATFDKNPDYWASDDKYPQNRLPYIDQITGLIMPEEATRLAALRAGTLDYLGTPGNTQVRTIDQVESVQRISPDLVVWQYPYRSDNSFGVNVQKPPFDDIRVRQAMQMALDLDTIYSTYYKGYGSTRPQGVYGEELKGWTTPFEEWPEAVRKVYTHDPAGAEALLDAAGYPRGADGTRFKTVLSHLERYDTTFAELAAAQWGEVGVDVEVRVTPVPEFVAVRTEGLFEMISAELGGLPSPSVAGLGAYYTTTSWAHSNVSDPVYDAMYEAQQAATTVEESRRLTREGYLYALERHWSIWGGEVPQFNVSQPWVKGYNGEIWLGVGQQDTFFSRIWIDSELKEAMGF